MVLTTRQFQSQQYNATAIDARGPIVLARAAACQIVGLLVQLGELSQFALDIYHALGYETFSTSSRIDSIAFRTAAIENKLSIYSDEIESTPPSYYFHNNSEMNWKRSDSMTAGLFSVDSRSIPLAKLVQTAFAPPNMTEMTEFIGRDCAQLYSDPDFFFKHWAAEEQRKLEIEAQEKKKQRQARPKRQRRQTAKIEVQAIEVKVYSAHGKEFSDFGTSASSLGASRSTGVNTVAAPRPVVVSSASPASPVTIKPALQAQPSISTMTNHQLSPLPPSNHDDNDYQPEETYSQQYIPAPAFTAPQPSQPPQPQSPPSPVGAGTSQLDEILAAKVSAAARLAPPPPRATVIVPPPAAIVVAPPPTSPRQEEENYYQPPPPQQQQQQQQQQHDYNSPQDYYQQPPPPQQQQYHQPPPPPQQQQQQEYYAPPPTPLQPLTPPSNYPSPPQSPVVATPPAAAIQRPVNPAAAALMGAGGLPKLNKPTPAAEAPTPRGNPLMGAIRGGIQLKSAAEAKAADPAPPKMGGGGLLADIKSRPMLRKASVVASSAASRPAPPGASAGPSGLSAVMDILARRGAIADTDSESDDDDDWD